jgi:hypothetical protein
MPGTLNSMLRLRFVSGSDYFLIQSVDGTAGRLTTSVELPNQNQTLFFLKDASNRIVIDVLGYVLPNGGT